VEAVLDEMASRGPGWELPAELSRAVPGQAVLPVDGRPTEFKTLSLEREWVARTRLADHVLTLEGNDFPLQAVTLERVEDLEPYVRGSRAFDTWGA
jgi:hypothetical protein